MSIGIRSTRAALVENGTHRWKEGRLRLTLFTLTLWPTLVSKFHNSDRLTEYLYSSHMQGQGQGLRRGTLWGQHTCEKGYTALKKGCTASKKGRKKGTSPGQDPSQSRGTQFRDAKIEKGYTKGTRPRTLTLALTQTLA